MGARTIRRRDESVRRKQETLALWKIIAAVSFPLALACILVAIDMRSDLSELKSTGRMDDKGAAPVGWSDLGGLHGGPARVRMIGYMMDGYQPSRDGAQVDMFILLPEAGQFLHPARRIPNQMVEARPSHPVVFRYRDLVWASGILSRTAGISGGGSAEDEKAAYAMMTAEVNRAAGPDIGKWFHP